MSDDLGSFFAEISTIEESVAVSAPVESASADVLEIATVAPGPVVVQSQVISKPAEIKSQVEKHAVYTYDFADVKPSRTENPTVDPYAHYTSIATSSSSSSSSFHPSHPSHHSYSHFNQPSEPVAPPMAPRQNKTFVRSAAEEVWVDETLAEWPENDYRIFVGDLGKEVTTEHLAKHFQIYKSFAKAKVMRFLS